MLEAYLQGLLRPVESITQVLVETVMLEALSSKRAADAKLEALQAELAKLPLMKADSLENLQKRIPRDLTRVSELRELDVYAFLRSEAFADPGKGESDLSSVQLFKFMDQHGIFDKLNA